MLLLVGTRNATVSDHFERFSVDMVLSEFIRSKFTNNSCRSSPHRGNNMIANAVLFLSEFLTQGIGIDLHFVQAEFIQKCNRFHFETTGTGENRNNPFPQPMMFLFPSPAIMIENLQIIWSNLLLWLEICKSFDPIWSLRIWIQGSNLTTKPSLIKQFRQCSKN